MTTNESQRLTPVPKIIGLATALSLVIAVVLLAFAWPSLTASPKDLPVGIVGSADQVDEIRTKIQDQADGAVALTVYDDRDAAVAAIEHREAYGAVVLAAEPTTAPEVLIASAAGAAPTQLLQGMATTLQAQIDATIRDQVAAGVNAAQEQAATTMQETLAKVIAAVRAGQAPALPEPSSATPFEIPTVTVQVTDVVPLAATDERGTGLALAALPLVMGGLIGGVALSLAVSGAARRMVAVTAYSAIAGVVLAAVLQPWLGVLQGSFALNASALALSVAAISAFVTGLYGLLGRAGIGIGAALMMLIGNPLSASAMPVEFLVAPWGTIGQALPPGATTTLLRSLSYFPGADTSPQWLVLAAWAVVGLACTLVAAVREHRARPVEATRISEPVAA